MKINVYLKDPDGFYDSVKDEVEKHLRETLTGLDEDEFESVLEARIEKAWEQLSKWVKFQEYVGIDFDLDAMTATVRPSK